MVMLEKYFLRRPVETDQPSILELMIRCDVRDVGQPDSDLEDLRYDWQQIDLNQDAWLAFNGEGVLKSYGAVLPWSCGKRLAIYDDPGTENDELFLSLLVLCEGRAANQLRATADPLQKKVVTHVSDSVEYQKKVLEDAGYSISRFIYNMHIDINGNLPEPQWPEGVEVRNAKTGIDDRYIHAVIQDAFHKPDHPDQPFEEWKEFMMRADLYQSDLWFLALNGEDVVGTCLCFPYEDLGWVRQLAVAQPFRKRGLGTALLQHSFRAFKQRGYNKVGLAVESSNENAYRLYERAGMYKAIHLDEYQKTLDV